MKKSKPKSKSKKIDPSDPKNWGYWDMPDSESFIRERDKLLAKRAPDLKKANDFLAELQRLMAQKTQTNPPPWFDPNFKQHIDVNGNITYVPKRNVLEEEAKRNDQWWKYMHQLGILMDQFDDGDITYAQYERKYNAIELKIKELGLEVGVIMSNREANKPLTKSEKKMFADAEKTIAILDNPKPKTKKRAKR